MSERPNCDRGEPVSSLICPYATWADTEIARLQSLCDSLAEDNERSIKDRERLRDEVERLTADQRADTIEKQRDTLVEALNTALQLQDQMLNEIRSLNILAGSNSQVPLQLIIAKRNFDLAMRKLLTSPR